MWLRIVSVLFPLFAISALGFAVGRRRRLDLSQANALNMDVFTPALSFVALASRSFDPATYAPLVLAALVLIAGSGLAAWAAARLAGIEPKTLVPPMMFNNCGNLGLPIAVLAFGPEALAPAVVLFTVSNVLHFSFGAWLLDHRTRLLTVWKNPSVLASLAGVLVHLLDLPAREQALLLVFGALPPAVLNYMFAERYGQEPDKVASIVLIGNLAAVVFLPIALALALR